MDVEKPATAEELVTCFNKTFSDIEYLKQSKGIDSSSNYNIVLSNGNRIIATRYSTDTTSDNRSLHFAEKIACNFNNETGDLEIEECIVERSAALISSEMLTDDRNLWKEIPTNHAVSIDSDMQVSLHKLKEVKDYALT
jgi:glutamine amidotransferase